MKRLSRVTDIVVLTVSFISAGTGIYFFGHTLTAWWLPVLIATLVALLAAGLAILLGFRRGRPYGYMTLGGTFLLAGTISYAILLSSNYLLAPEDSRHEEMVTVERKYSKEKQSGGGGRYRRGPRRTYHTYHIEVIFPSGRHKEVDVPLSRYNRIRCGSTLTVECSNGFLGIPVWREKKNNDKKTGT